MADVQVTRADREAAVRATYGDYSPGSWAHEWVEKGGTPHTGWPVPDVALAIATARAEGYAAGVEEAAVECERCGIAWDAQSVQCGKASDGAGWMAANTAVEALNDAADMIRALAAREGER